MRVKVNPNRMELLKLRKRLQLARRGHKLLKDKQEELLRRFNSLLEEVREMRMEVEDTLGSAQRRFLSARAEMEPHALEEVLHLSAQKAQVKCKEEPIMNLRVPHFELLREDSPSSGFSSTSGDLDEAISLFSELLPKMVALAQREKSLFMVARELQKTRRRVNALEHILLPSLEETISYITEKLSEQERANLTRLMKIRDLLRRHEI